MDRIKCMHAFTAVALQNSFTLGAKQIGVSTKVASKYVQQLELQLGVQLFNRTTRSVNLTEIGQLYYEKCLNLLDQFDEMESMVQQKTSKLAGNIRVTAPTGFGAKDLIKALMPFQKLHPEVIIDLHLSDNVVSIVEEGFDLAIRFGKLADSNLVAQKLLTMPVLVMASPEYLKKNGTPLHPSELINHNCLTMKLNSLDPNHWEFTVDNKEQLFKVGGSFKANSPRALAHMALGGLGIARVPFYHANEFVKNKTLSVLFEDFTPMQIELYAIFANSRYLTLRARALIDHLKNYYKNDHL